MTAAYLTGIGRQDRLAALCLAVTAFDSRRRRDGVRPRRRAVGEPRQGDVGAQGIPRRADAGRGVRVAPARGPGVELLGEQLPDGKTTPGVRHPVLELRHHPDDRRTARRLRRPGDGPLADAVRGPHRARRADRPPHDHRGLLRGGRHRRPHHPVGELLPKRSAPGRDEPASCCRPVVTSLPWSTHPATRRRPSTPTTTWIRRQGLARGLRSPRRAPGGPISGCGWTNAAAGSVRRPRRSGRTV